jgi:AcrR family transcriptional regulator
LYLSSRALREVVLRYSQGNQLVGQRNLRHTVGRLGMGLDDEGRALDLLWRTLDAADGRSSFCRECGEVRSFHRVTRRRSYACDRCGWQIYPAAGTPFARSPLPLSKWLDALSIMSGSSTRPTAGHIAERLEVGSRTAWTMRRRIEQGMKGGDRERRLLRKLAQSWSDGSVSVPAHTIAHGTPETRICEAACRVMAERGLADTRVADIAAAAGLSSASIHYHFRSKDEVLLAAFRWACTQSNEALQALVEERLEPAVHVQRLAELCMPVEGTARDEYVLWLELWARVRDHPGFLEESVHMSKVWYDGVYRIFLAGVRDGSFEPIAPLNEVCRRFLALSESLSYRATVGYNEMSPEEGQAMLVRFAKEQLRISPVTASPSAP